MLRRLRTLTVAAAAGMGLMLTLAGTASADVSVPYDGSGSEVVYCDSSSHKVTITFDTIGEDSGQYGGSDLFPYSISEPVWVYIWAWYQGQWYHDGWVRLNNYGVGSVSYTGMVGTSYWYFQYAFASPNGGYDQPAEWAGGAGRWGIYSDQYGYHTQPSCVS
jgi:hypothetical protein